MTQLPKPIEQIQTLIHTIRGQRVVLDADLASVYGTTTKRLNEQVKRNRKRFPPDFIFQITALEKNEVVAICDHLRTAKTKISRSPTKAFGDDKSLLCFFLEL